jgi:chromosome segregation ATPase
MINIHVSASLEYDTTTTIQLAQELKSLHHFDEFTEWNKKAVSEIEILQTLVDAIEEKIEAAIQIISQEQKKFMKKTLFAKLFDSRKELKRWISEEIRLGRERTQINDSIEQFKAVLDIILDSNEKLEKLIEECKHQRKELTIEKKSLKALISSIRLKAKQQNANTNYGKFGRGDRSLIKLNKKAALLPQKNKKDALKYQIANLDIMIHWLEGFKQ